MLKAYIRGQVKDILDCSDGIVTTFYKMIDGRKNIGAINEFLITNNLKTSIISLEDELNNKRIDKINSINYSVTKLGNDLKVIKEILFYTYDLLNDVKAAIKDIHSGGVPEEYLFIGRMCYTHHGMSIVELSKLFTDSNSQYYNLFSLLRKIMILIERNQLNENLCIQDIQKYQIMLNDLMNDDMLQHLRFARNKIFAHTDKEIFETSGELKLDYSRLEKLQAVGFIIIQELYSKIFNIYIEPYDPNTAVDSVLRMINKEIKREK